MNVLFVNMPFGAIRPAIGVSLLKAHLANIGISSRILYLNLRFAKLVGGSDFQYIADGAPSQSLAGDWVFSRCAFGLRSDADAAYLESFPRRFARFSATCAGVTVLKHSREESEKFIQDCLDQVDWQSYDVIGFTSTFTQHVASLALARRVKERYPRTRIVFGGGNCEAEMGLQFHRMFPFVDFVCSGEADVSFPKLMRTLRDGGDICRIPGVISRRDGRSNYMTLAPERVQNLDILPYPDYDDYFEQLREAYPENKQPAAVLMETSRGCWWGQKHHCTFCGLNGTSMGFRSKSAQRVLDEIGVLCERYQPQFVEMVDNILDMAYFRELIPELGKRKLKLGMFYETKANLSKDQLRALYDAGIFSIQPGIESLSTDILRIMRKGTSAMQNIQLLKWCKELGMKPFWNLIYGFPGENPMDYKTTADIMDSIHHLQPPVGFGAIRLDRFSPNFTYAEELGIKNVRPDRNYGWIYDLPQPELFDLAYYFEHDYADGRDPEAYVGKAFDSFCRWQREADASRLVYVDHGETLAVWDLRPSATRTLTILRGNQKAVYLYCDQSRSLQNIETFLGEAANVVIRPFLAELIKSRLMIQLDGRFLSLAVKANSPRSGIKPAAKQRREEHLVL